jgi:hypothetical protein
LAAGWCADYLSQTAVNVGQKMSITSSEIQRIYLDSISLDYSLALDLAAQMLRAAGGRILAVISSPMFATELYKRCSFPLELSAAADFGNLGALVEASQGWNWGSVQVVEADMFPQASYQALLWVETQRASSQEIAQRLRRAAAPGASLAIITSSFLRCFLPEWAPRRKMLAVEPLSPGQATRCLGASGWKIEQQIGFHGPRSVLWSLLYRAAVLARRPDWADRCLFGSRAVYQETEWLINFSPIVLTRARAI